MVFYRRGPFEGYARCKPDFPPMDMIDPITPPIYQPFPQAVLFPFLFFFGTSVIESAKTIQHVSIHIEYPMTQLEFTSNDFSIHSRRHVPGGKLCFNLSAFSESFNTSVYMNREHRTLNLIWWGLRFMCPAKHDQHRSGSRD